MVDRGLLSIREVDVFYGYRYANIVRNSTIKRAKLDGLERMYWGRFIDLGVKLDRHGAQKRAPGRDENATAR